MTRSKPIAQAEHGANRRENKVAGSKKLATLATFATKDTGKYPSVEKEEDIVINQNVTTVPPYVDKDLSSRSRRTPAGHGDSLHTDHVPHVFQNFAGEGHRRVPENPRKDHRQAFEKMDSRRPNYQTISR